MSKFIILCILFFFTILGCESIQNQAEKEFDSHVEKQIKKVDTLVNKQIDNQLKKYRYIN